MLSKRLLLNALAVVALAAIHLTMPQASAASAGRHLRPVSG